MGGPDQKGFLRFADKGTSNCQGHRATQDVAKVVDERMDHYLAKVLDFDRDHVRVLGFRVATLGASPLFVLMHISIL